MKNEQALQDLLQQQELSLSIYRQIPEGATDLSVMNGHTSFYALDQYVGQAYRKPVRRYVDFLEAFRPMLDLEGTIEAFIESNQLIPVLEFSLGLARKYPIEILTEAGAWQIEAARPSETNYFNHVANRYYRQGPGEYAEFYVYGEHGEASGFESSYLNNEIESKFINLENLLNQLQIKQIESNYAI